jgi:hypothetical protein
MGKQATAWNTMQKKRWTLMILALFTLLTLTFLFFTRSAFNSCKSTDHFQAQIQSDHFQAQIQSASQTSSSGPNPLGFMKSKLVLLVSHELSLSGTQFLLPFLFVSVYFREEKCTKWRFKIKLKADLCC